MQPSAEILNRIRNNIKKVIIGKDDVIDLLLISLLCSGHVLIEDIPGTGKTTIVSALAASLGCSFKRIQFTPDVLPSDITGFNMFNMKTGEQEFHQGLVMNQIILADEINRTSPKTQSALLEVMQENQVTIDGKTYPAPRPFMVLATQNPVEMAGTYPLPEAQLDRFLMCISIGYPSREEEVQILANYRPKKAAEVLSPVASAEDIIRMQQELENIHCSKEILKYIIYISESTRKMQGVKIGISPRGSIALMLASKGCAMLEGRSFVLPDDVQRMAYPVLSHRLILHGRLRQQTDSKSIITNILRTTPVPAAR
ncbi:MAG TPA: MoxR family ATPase [Clostridiales bacterium]|nr:MoxR family ATPase [Clostridiales bacterium]